jgi:phytoene dehydrogenase-like protein
MAERADVIVIGAGHNGLVAAGYLARSGLDVLVLEASDWIGGCTTSAALLPAAPEHRMSPCADDVIALRDTTVGVDLELARFGYREVEIDPPYLALASDGASLALHRHAERTAAEIRHFAPQDAVAYLRLIEDLRPACDAAMTLMATNPVRPDPRAVAGAVRALLRRPRALPEVVGLSRTSAADAIRERFTHPLVQAMLANLASYGCPITWDRSGVNLMIVPMIMRAGMARPTGGMGTLPAALERSFTASGGRIRTAARVEEFLMSAGRVSGVRLHSGEEIRAATVLAATEPWRVLNQFLPPGTLPTKLAARAADIPTRSAGCAHFKIEVAFRGRLTLPAHQKARRDDLDVRIPTHMVGTIDEICAAIDDAGAGRLPDPLPFASMVKSAADPAVAPAGQELLGLWSGWVPLHPEESWDSLKATAEKSLIAHAQHYYAGFEELEIGRWVESPPEMTARTNVPDGNVYHVDLTPSRMGPLRPARGFAGYRTPVPGLYLSGGGTHPGPSVSGLPGQQAARTLLRDLRRKRMPSR